MVCGWLSLRCLAPRFVKLSLAHFGVTYVPHYHTGKEREKNELQKVIRWRMVYFFLFFTPAPVLWLVFLCLRKTTGNAIYSILSLPQNLCTLRRNTAYALSICVDARVTHVSVVKLHGVWGFGCEMWSGTQWFQMWRLWYSIRFEATHIL